MDPNECVRLMQYAHGEGEYDHARSSALDLIRWLRRGGFPPEGHTRASALRMAAMIHHDATVKETRGTTA